MAKNNSSKVPILFFLRSWVRASWINVNNFPTRCDYTQFIIFLYSVPTSPP